MRRRFPSSSRPLLLVETVLRRVVVDAMRGVVPQFTQYQPTGAHVSAKTVLVRTLQRSEQVLILPAWALVAFVHPTYGFPSRAAHAQHPRARRADLVPVGGVQRHLRAVQD